LNGAGDLFKRTIPADHSMDITQGGFKKGAQKPRMCANRVFQKVRSHKESRDGSKKDKKDKKGKEGRAFKLFAFLPLLSFLLLLSSP